MRRALRLAAPPVLAAAALLGVPGSGTAAPVVTDLARLQGQLSAATAQATAAADALEAAAARSGGLRVRLDRLAEQRDTARDAVDARARQAYLAGAGRHIPLAEAVAALAAPDLRRLADAELARRGQAAAVRAAVELVTAVDEHSAAAAELQQQASAYRASLAAQAEQALAAQEQARVLLAQAERQAAEARDRRRAEQVAAAVAAARARLDAASSTVTRALTPAESRRSRSAAEREAPLVALVEAAGAGYPDGYLPTGTVLRGQASWYGPGFVGNPTASGAPYDPERLTCAHQTLPLGTLVRVTRDGTAISCLVNDRGPYVGDRIIDLSRAGSRSLGFDGVAQVSVEVLAPGR